MLGRWSFRFPFQRTAVPDVRRVSKEIRMNEDKPDRIICTHVQKASKHNDELISVRATVGNLYARVRK